MNTVLRATMLVLGVALGLTGCTSGDSNDPTNSPQPGTQQPTSTTTGRHGFDQIPSTVQRVEPSVVTIVNDGGIGSGVVYQDGGVIVTNQHVVQDAQQVEVALADGSRIDGDVVATDQITDLAVVRTDREDLPPAEFQETLPQVGELALAMGSPLGFENSVTVGIVSGLGREIPGGARQSRALVDLIQTDAPISPGSSGGALVNEEGQVVGINEAYIPPQTGAVSLGFAIPAGTVVDIVEQLLDDGTAAHPYLGIRAAQLTPQIAEALGLELDRGVLVREVVGNSPAAETGLQSGDIIIDFAGQPVPTVEDFFAALRDVSPGDEVQMRIDRGGESQTLSITVGQRENSASSR